ncbi:MAG: hypothetical protein ABIK28_01715 [Planctomycetota bacterium]
MKGIPLRGKWFILFAGFACLTLCGCWDERTSLPQEELDRLAPAAVPEKEIISKIEGDSPESLGVKMKLARTFVKPAAQLRSPAFQKAYFNNSYSEVAMGQQLIQEMLSFTGPMQDYQVPQWYPQDILKMHSEALHMVQRCPPEGRKQIFQDMEIFLVFKALYDDLSQEERIDLVKGWQRKHGHKASPVPEGESYYPLFWMRNNPMFWEKGGRFWWWAAHALMKDPLFQIEKDGRVLIVHPDNKRVYTS